MASYEEIVNPKQIDLRLTGQLSDFDDDHERLEIDMKGLQEIRERNSQWPFDYTSNHVLFRKCIHKQVDLKRFFDLMKKKVIYDYEVLISLKAEYHNSPFFVDIQKYTVNVNPSKFRHF